MKSSRSGFRPPQVLSNLAGESDPRSHEGPGLPKPPGSSKYVNLILMTETIPMELTADGVIRISGTRVTLDTVMGAFRGGASAEEIADQYPSVPLGDMYEVIGYALRHAD